MDFVGPDQLIKILNEVKNKLPPDQKLAFDEKDYLVYYQYPFASLSFENDTKIIELKLPLVKIENNAEMFRLYKLRTYPVACWDTTICKQNKSYELKLNHNIIFANATNEYVFSTNLNDLECMMYFDKKLCFMIEQDDYLNIDTCLNNIYNPNHSINSCRYEQTELKPVKLKSNKNKIYETFYNEKGLLVGKVTNLKDNSSSQFNIYDLLGNKNDSLNKNLFISYTFEEAEDYVKAKDKLNQLSEEIVSQAKYYENRTVGDMLKETGLDSILLDKKAEVVQVKTSWSSRMILILPYLVGILILIITNQWFIIGVLNVAIRVHGTHAQEIAKGVHKKVAEASLNKLYNEATDYLHTIWDKCTEVILIILICVLLMYIIYNTLYKAICIEHYYGQVRPNRRSEPTTSWFVIITSVVKINHLFGQTKRIIDIAYELPFDIHAMLFTPEAKSCWMKSSNRLQLMNPIQIHHISNNSHLVTNFPIEIDSTEIDWNYKAVPELQALHGKIVNIKLTRLSDESHSKTLAKY